MTKNSGRLSRESDQLQRLADEKERPKKADGRREWAAKLYVYPRKVDGDENPGNRP
jgi:hypothetical protein